MFADEPIIRFDAEKGRGVLQSISAARSALGYTPRAVAATHLAWAKSGAVVHFWDDGGTRHFVANDDAESLVGAPRDAFESRSLPISTHLGREPLVGDGEAGEDEREEAAPTRTWSVLLRDCVPLVAWVHVEATSEEDAMAIVKSRFDDFAAAANDEAMERLQLDMDNWDGWHPSNIEEAEPCDE